MGNIGKEIEQVCIENNTNLKSVNAKLEKCTIEIETESEKFEINYKFFNPVVQCFVFV